MGVVVICITSIRCQVPQFYGVLLTMLVSAFL